MRQLLESIPFRDRTRALGNLSRLAGVFPEGIQSRIRFLLASSADPDSALHWLEELRGRQPAAFSRLTHSKANLQYLVTIFSHSRFLSEEVVQHPEWLEHLPASGDLHRMMHAEEYIDRLERFLGKDAGIPSALSLALFRRQQILRILLRDVLGLCTLSESTDELSYLADAILDVSYRRLRADLIKRYGRPRYRDDAGELRPCEFSVIALGKLGGLELNYSSDIDLMFLYSGGGETDGENSITNKEFYKKVANQLTDLLSVYTSEGLCYRVDLRLRPDGSLGEVCISLDGARHYYKGRARDWELQMLIKARVAAGNVELGRQLLEFVEPLIYSTTLDFGAVEAVSVTRERISEKLAAKRKGDSAYNIKLARGGIRDIEFLVQCLQRLHGGREPWVRHGGTILALFRLRDKDLLSPSEYSRLASAYQLLRNLEHRLQLVEDRQTHTLPANPEDLELLARRMPAADLGAEPTADRLLRTLNRHLEEVQEIYERVIHAQKPIYYNIASVPPITELPEESARIEAALAAASDQPELHGQTSNLVRFLDQLAPDLAALIARGTLRRGLRHFEHFLEKIISQPERLKLLNSDPVLTGYVFDLFEHSPYFAEQLIRASDLIDELLWVRESPGEQIQYGELAATLSDAGDLRRFFRRQMFRIQCESICLELPIFTTLKRTSALADATIAAAYRMALEQVLAGRPPEDASYKPSNQMMVIALGRLGMLEFDLGSDADLVFVLKDQDAQERVFWTRVAERLIDIITAYTGEGVIFAVDTRLRPNGREGALVQLESAYHNYFAKRAEAWEGITYMKTRAVAGDIERGTLFLNELQDVDWRRYGQSGRSRKELRQMRLRLEKEQGAGNPLKAGPGGYYDIDFALMYLRLKGAGIFFKVLNTPERIDVIEKMGHLERADAAFLRDAATFYRAVDHGLRVSSGQAEGNLPHSETHLGILANLVSRWTADHLHDQPLPVEMEQIRLRTREYFDRLFG